MFNIFSKKKNYIYAPITGELMELSTVKDEVFSSGMMGEGIAILPSDSLFVAPADGEIILIPETKHAFGMKLNTGVELLIHIGLDTALYKGEGFESYVKEGQEVKVGMPIIKVDLEYFKGKGVILETPIIILDKKKYNIEFMNDNKRCKAGETKIIQY